MKTTLSNITYDINNVFELHQAVMEIAKDKDAIIELLNKTCDLLKSESSDEHKDAPKLSDIPWQQNKPIVVKYNHAKAAFLPAEGEKIFIGDLHGDLYALLKILSAVDFFTTNTQLVSLGDIIDRGKLQLETLIGVCLLKLLASERVTTLYGNHEIRSMQQQDNDYNLRAEINNNAKLQDCCNDIMNAACDCFEQFPVAAFTKEGSMLVHGGIPHFVFDTPPTKLSDLFFTSQHITELLWNDPTYLDRINYIRSQRGLNTYNFNPNVLDILAPQLDINSIFRSHQPPIDGNGANFMWSDNDHTICTLFSTGAGSDFSYYQNRSNILMKTFSRLFKTPTGNVTKPRYYRYVPQEMQKANGDFDFDKASCPSVHPRDLAHLDYKFDQQRLQYYFAPNEPH